MMLVSCKLVMIGISEEWINDIINWICVLIYYWEKWLEHSINWLTVNIKRLIKNTGLSFKFNLRCQQKNEKHQWHKQGIRTLNKISLNCLQMERRSIFLSPRSSLSPRNKDPKNLAHRFWKSIMKFMAGLTLKFIHKRTKKLPHLKTKMGIVKLAPHK